MKLPNSKNVFLLLLAAAILFCSSSSLTAQDLDTSNPDARGIAMPEADAPVLLSSGPCVGPLGDVNGDQCVNLLDVAPMAFLIFTGTYLCEGDVTMDGFVNVLDIPDFIMILVQG